MIGRIETFSHGSASGVIKAEDGHTVHFDSTAVLAYDVSCLAGGQLVTFELGRGKCPKALNVCVERVLHISRGDEKHKAVLSVRYVGFEQTGTLRAYRFERIAPGEQTATFIVNTDLTLFSRHHVLIQEGPALCLRCLLAELDAAGTLVRPMFQCSLTDRDMLAHLASLPVPKPRLGARRAPVASAAAGTVAAPFRRTQNAI